jgi:hypothetical protein
MEGKTMIMRILPVLLLALALTSCTGVYPQKYSSRKISICQTPSTALDGVPYTRLSKDNCAAAIAPFDLSVWIEAPLNSHKVRGLDTVELGCKPLTPEAENCPYSGVPGKSNTLIVNFDPSVYPEGASVQKAVLALYSPGNPKGLYDAQLRGRLNIGDEQQSLARNREIFSASDKSADGWVLYDVSSFAARAINERRNSIQFEVSLPCETAEKPVTVGVLKHEPRLLVEFK